MKQSEIERLIDFREEVFFTHDDIEEVMKKAEIKFSKIRHSELFELIETVRFDIVSFYQYFYKFDANAEDHQNQDQDQNPDGYIYNCDGYNRFGFDKNGYNKDGFDRIGNERESNE